MTVEPDRFHPMTPAPPPPPQKQSSGCGKLALIGCAIVLLLGGVAVVAVVFGVFGVIKKSDVYSEARNRAVADPRVIAVLGEPIKTGWLVGGSLQIKNRAGTADLAFQISGPKGKARVDAVATRDAERWTFTTLTVKPSGGATIDILRP